MTDKTRVCVLGAGPVGLSFVHHNERLRSEGHNVPDVVCYEKQKTWGGMWNYTWRTGLDEYGEVVHGSMYQNLWSNGPKELGLEFPDYPYGEHYNGKLIPSYVPRHIVRDYLDGRFKKYNIKQFIRFETSVKEVKYHADTDKFSVVVKDLSKDITCPTEIFDYVIDATGHFSVPHVPEFEGFDKFKGLIVHSSDLKDIAIYKGQCVLLIGAGLSGHDLAIQLHKYGATKIIISYKSQPLNFKWPDTVTEVPLLQRMEGKTAHFKDGSTAQIDSIILCTGYEHHHPHMEDSLRLTNYPEYPQIPKHLYKGAVWTKGGNMKLIYLGAFSLLACFHLFDVQCFWALKYVMGEIKRPSKKAIEENLTYIQARLEAMKTLTDRVPIHNDYAHELKKESDYPYDVDFSKFFLDYFDDLVANSVLEFRDKNWQSQYYPGIPPSHDKKFIDILDENEIKF